jgi:hypothetical protein
MKLSKWLKAYMLWEQAKQWLWLPLLLALATIMVFQWAGPNRFGSPLLNLLSDPVVSTLLGAILGGAIAFYGSVYVQKSQIRSLSAIRRRDVIYTPLYNELLALRASLTERPCPSDFVYSTGQDSHYNPKFAVWPSFKLDSRNLQVPKRLAKTLDDFQTLTEKYVAARQKASTDPIVQAKLKEIVVGNFGEAHAQRVDLAWHLLPCSSNLDEIVKHLDFTSRIPDKDNRLVSTSSDEYLLAVAKAIYRECSSIDSVAQVQTLRKALSDGLDELIRTLEDVIRYINEKFEQHEKWF